MNGPEAMGHWSGHIASNASRNHQFLEAGRHYCVIRPFADHDGHVHPQGEQWTFLGSAFLPYDDGLSLFVSLDGQSEWHIPLQWRADQQAPVVDNLAQYVQHLEVADGDSSNTC
jgi:hypothetical protein